MQWEAVLHEPLFLFSIRIVAFDLIMLHLEYFDTFWWNFYIEQNFVLLVHVTLVHSGT